MGTYVGGRMRLLILSGVATALFAAAPSPASAAPWRCEASAITGSLLAGKVQLPSVRANAGALDCASKTAGGALKLPLPLDSAAVVAQTAISGTASDPAAQKVLATGGIADLRVKSLPQLPIALPELPIPAELKALGVDVPAITDPVLGLTLVPAQRLTLDLTSAINALVTGRALPDADLLRVQGAVAYASAGCVDGAPKLAGASQVAGISVLGTELPVGQIVDQALTLLDSGNIDPSNLDLSKIALPAGLGLDLPLVGPVLQTSIRQALDALPPISIPAAIAQVKVTPGEQTNAGGMLIQRALRIQVGLLGQSLVDATVGEAAVGAGDVNCAPNPALECTRKPLVLVDVFERKGRVQLLGVAHRQYAGRVVDIVFEATDKVVAKAKVARDGSFETTAPLPPKSIRSGNDARYMAVLGQQESMNLKLARRMIVDEMVARGGRVTILGRITGLMADAGKDREILVTRRVSCTKMEKVGVFKPRSDGTFSIAVKAPKGERTAVYRLSTLVRKTESNPKTFPTYTLPRAVNLLGQ